MRVMLEINDVDFHDWLAEDGIKYSPIERVKRSVVCMNGKEFRKTIEKQKLDVTLLDMPDEELAKAEAALAKAYPARVNYMDKKGVEHTGVLFYPSGISANIKKVIGTITYWTNITFSLEEQG